MKNVFVFGLMALSLSCGNLKEDKVQAFIPGIYIRDIADEYTTGKDTLVIRISDPRISMYRVERRTSYQQRADGKLLKPQHKVENWTAVYDREHGQLHEQRKGKILSFLPEQNKLSLGGSAYQKLPN